jgi:hypothetical protein
MRPKHKGSEDAVAVHRGAYDHMDEAHAIGKWMAANRRESAGRSCDTYGDPTVELADTETALVHLLKLHSLIHLAVSRPYSRIWPTEL